MAIHVRWMIRRDIPEVLDIDARTGGDWTEADIIAAMRKRNCIGMVAEHGESVVGFEVIELYRNHIRVVDFRVSPDYDRQGVGRQMLDKVKSKLNVGRRYGVVLDVPDTNLPMHLFLQSQGFRCDRVNAHQFDNGDGYRFTYRLPSFADANCIGVGLSEQE